MSFEEWRFDLWPGTFVPEPEAVAPWLHVGPPEQYHEQASWWDTHDRRLARFGIQLVGRGTRWEVVAAASSTLATWAADGQSGSPAEVMGGLIPVLGSMEPAWMVDVEIDGVSHHLRDGAGRELAEVRIELVSASDASGTSRRFRSVAVALVPDAPTELSELLGAWLDRAGATRASGSLAQQLMGPVPERAELSGGRAGRAADRLIARSVASLRLHAMRVLHGGDAEDVHQARVAIRRLRSGLRVFAPTIDAEWSERVGPELQWLGSELGALRDLEVMGERLTAHGMDLGPPDSHVLADAVLRMDAEAEERRGQVTAALSGARGAELFESLWDHPVLDAELDLSKVLRRQWRHLKAAVGRVDPGELDTLHRVRIRAKRLRYASEAVSDEVRGAKALGRAAAGLQEVLGALVDAAVLEQWCRAEAERAGDPAEIMVLGRVVERERIVAADAVAQWPSAWKVLRREARHRWSD